MEPPPPAVPSTSETPGSPRDDGVDVSLIRWMLSLSPAERLDVLQAHVDAVVALRSRGFEE